MGKIRTHLNVNGHTYEVEVEPKSTLLHVLRNDLGLTGSKLGCGKGECGSCTIIMDGKAVPSCLILAAHCEGKKIITIEELQNGDRLHPLQEAFVKYGAIQCGFCTPGMVLSAKAMLDNNPSPTEEEVREALLGNLCRCTGYQKIVEAIMATTKNGKRML
ncbi:MAG TPA: (2Fe-2S)-binding protein [Candidatus Bathyarchaeia archaeon]|nr:(2Fe-2S)-binding protein [Candidatus Bathyarchaeia archaeon]